MIVYSFDFGELYIAQPVIDPFYTADVDIQDDVARLRIDCDGPTWAFPGHALRRVDEAVAIRLTASFFQSLIDQVHPIPATDRKDIRVTSARNRRVIAYKPPVQHRGMVPVVMGDCDKTERHVAHALERGIVGEVAVAQHHCLASVDAVLADRLTQGCGLCPRWNPDVDAVRIGILRALHVNGEVGLRHGKA